jgi:hypothetical protein
MAENPRQEDTEARRDKIPKNQVIGLAIVGATLIVVVVGLGAYVRPSDPTEKKDFVQAIGVLLAGLVGFGGLYFTWRNLNQTRQVTQRTLELTERGQITERFTRAIDQLGATDDKGDQRLELRLGGIYALERIARDSEEDHWPIMDVLTAYVRQHTPPRSREAPDPDIQAIMTVIRRRIRHFPNGEPEFIDLHETDLQGANLSEANLRGANLYKANLYGADLHEANLSEANLSAAILSGADLHKANLSEANLSEAKLYGANFAEAHLEGANLEEAQSLLPDQLEEAVIDEGTILLNHLRTDPGLASGSSYHVEQGDTLWRIADKKYNNGNKWHRIHQANDWILDPHRILAGWWIWIPPR